MIQCSASSMYGFSKTIVGYQASSQKVGGCLREGRGLEGESVWGRGVTKEAGGGDGQDGAVVAVSLSPSPHPLMFSIQSAASS